VVSDDRTLGRSQGRSSRRSVTDPWSWAMPAGVRARQHSSVIVFLRAREPGADGLVTADELQSTPGARMGVNWVMPLMDARLVIR